MDCTREKISPLGVVLFCFVVLPDLLGLCILSPVAHEERSALSSFALHGMAHLSVRDDSCELSSRGVCEALCARRVGTFRDCVDGSGISVLSTLVCAVSSRSR